MNPYYQMSGGGKCSLCGSEGTNKSSCPLNPDAKPNFNKHPNAVSMMGATPVSKSIKTVTIKAVVPSKKYIKPTKAEMEEILAVIAELEEVPSDEFWIDELSKMYVLTMKDLKDPEFPDFYLLQPQTYDDIKKFSEDPINKIEYFYDAGDGKAVTGSGSDPWGVVRPGMATELRKILIKWKSAIKEEEKQKKGDDKKKGKAVEYEDEEESQEKGYMDEHEDDQEEEDAIEIATIMEKPKDRITFGDVTKFVLPANVNWEEFDPEIYGNPTYADEMREKRHQLYELAEPLIMELNKMVGKKGPFVINTSFAEHSYEPEELGANETVDPRGKPIYDYDLIVIGQPAKPVTIGDIRSAIASYKGKPMKNRSYFFDGAELYDGYRIEINYGS